jgi:hypothetical protein
LPIKQALFPSKTQVPGAPDGKMMPRFAQEAPTEHARRHKDAIKIGSISPSKGPSNRYAIANPHC